MESQISNREIIMSRLEEDEDYQRNRAIISYHQDVMDDYTHLFWNRQRVDDFFLLLENVIHPTAQLRSTHLNIEDLEMKIEGVILNFEAMEQQYSILKDFKMERDVVGWVEEDSLREDEEDGTFLLNDSSIDLLRSPIGNRVLVTINGKEGEEVSVLQKADPEKYTFTGPGTRRELIENSWYEVRLIETIEPIEEVQIDSMTETEDDLNIRFEFSIKLKENLFKP